MNKQIKYSSLILGLLISFTALAEPVQYTCPSLHGSYVNDQAIGNWFFWSDKQGAQEVKINQWPGQKVRVRSGQYYNFGLVCHTGGTGPWEGVMMPVKATKCKAMNNNTFVCE